MILFFFQAMCRRHVIVPLALFRAQTVKSAVQPRTCTPHLLEPVDGQSTGHRDEHDEGEEQRLLEVPHISVEVF